MPLFLPIFIIDINMISSTRKEFSEQIPSFTWNFPNFLFQPFPCFFSLVFDLIPQGPIHTYKATSNASSGKKGYYQPTHRLQSLFIVPIHLSPTAVSSPVNKISAYISFKIHRDNIVKQLVLSLIHI